MSPLRWGFFVKKGGKKGAIFNEFANIKQIYSNEKCLANAVITRVLTIKNHQVLMLVSVRALQGKAARIPERRK